MFCAVTAVAPGPGPAIGATAPNATPPLAFAAFHTTYVGSWASSVAVGDFTGDGRQDVVMSTTFYSDPTNDYALFLFAQTASGAFASPRRLATFGSQGGGTMEAASGDLDGDGHTDLVLATNKGLDVFLQRDGNLVLTPVVEPTPAYEVDLADLDGDGRLDAIVNTPLGVRTLAGMGTGTFAPPKAIGDLQYTEIEIGDVTGDGLLDVVGFRTNTIDVLARRAGGDYGAPVQYPVAVGYWPDANGIAIGDFNGDGRNDIAASIGGNSPGALINVFIQRPDGTLDRPNVLPVYEIPGPLVAADVNLDGRTDLVTLHGGWTRAGILTQRRDGTLDKEQLLVIPYATSYAAKGLAVADVTGDGLPDLVLADYNHGLVVLRSAGQAQGWGLGNFGQLGNGTAADRPTPTAPLAVADLASVSAGAYHSLALTRDGRVWSWGLDHVGQLGIGSTTDRSVPTLVPGITGATSVAAGPVHSLAVKDDGTAWAWGWNLYGQLGLGSTVDRSVPTQVPGLSNVTAVAGGAAHSLALTADGSVWAWGLNHVGQLGTGTTVSTTVPVKVPGLTGIVAVSAGLFHSMALDRDGDVWTWGYNQDGELGTGSDALFDATPRKIDNVYFATAIAAGAFHSMAIAGDTTVWTWGDNEVGQLGDGRTDNSRVPTRVDFVYGIRAIAAGWYHNLAVSGDGTMYAWGWNYFGQLGDGTTTTARNPVLGPNLNPSVLTAGVAHSLVITARGA